MEESATVSISSGSSTFPSFLTILKYAVVAIVGASMLYSRLLDVEAQASANAKEIAVLKKDVASVGRIEEAVKLLQRSSEYQSSRTDDIYQLLTSMKGRN